MRTVKAIILVTVVFFNTLSYGQTRSSYIIFNKPYSNKSETNLYNDTVVKFNYALQRENLKNGDVQEDLNRALKNNDFRVIAISGVDYLFPGLEGGYKTEKNGTKIFNPLCDRYQAYLRRYGFKVIAGTSDVINGDELCLQNTAYSYAKAYNTLLLAKQHIKE